VDTRVPARSGRPQVLQLLHRLQHRPPHAGTATRLHELLETAAHQLKRRATVFVVSDFISEPGWEKPLGQLARRHEVVLVRLLDPLELELPNLGLIPMRDAESGEVLMVDTGDKGFRQRFAQLAEAASRMVRHQDKVLAATEDAGVITAELLAVGAARRVEDAPELAREILLLWADDAARAQMGAAGRNWHEGNRGAAARTQAALADLLRG
jgi:hypothetical protein